MTLNLPSHRILIYLITQIIFKYLILFIPSWKFDPNFIAYFGRVIVHCEFEVHFGKSAWCSIIYKYSKLVTPWSRYVFPWL